MLPRMRLLKDAYGELKALDSNTAVSVYFIRQLAITGKIPCAMAGRKRLINLDALIEYLANPNAEPNENGKIRRIG